MNDLLFPNFVDNQIENLLVAQDTILSLGKIVAQNRGMVLRSKKFSSVYLIEDEDGSVASEQAGRYCIYDFQKSLRVDNQYVSEMVFTSVPSELLMVLNTNTDKINAVDFNLQSFDLPAERNGKFWVNLACNAKGCPLNLSPYKLTSSQVLTKVA